MFFYMGYQGSFGYSYILLLKAARDPVYHTSSAQKRVNILTLVSCVISAEVMVHNAFWSSPGITEQAWGHSSFDLLRIMKNILQILGHMSGLAVHFTVDTSILLPCQKCVLERKDSILFQLHSQQDSKKEALQVVEKNPCIHLLNHAQGIINVSLKSWVPACFKVPDLQTIEYRY